MNRPWIAVYALTALATVWATIAVPASAQTRSMFDKILMSDQGDSDAGLDGPRIAVDGSGQWLSLRASADARARHGEETIELLQFDASEALTALEADPGLSAEDYRFAVTASKKPRSWTYDGDPLDRGSYKGELGGTGPGYRRTAGERVPESVPASRTMSHLQDASDAVPFSGNPGIVWIVTRAPRYVMHALKSVYGNDYSFLFAVGIVLVTLGFGALADMLRGARGA